MHAAISHKRVNFFRLSFFSILLILISSIVFTSNLVSAEESQAISGYCDAQGTRYSSPFNTTKGFCVGVSGDDVFYQFAIALPSPITSIQISGKYNNRDISFVKENDKLYVSNSIVKRLSSSCSSYNDEANKITITAKGNGKTETFTFNLCELGNKYIKYFYANSLAAYNNSANPQGTIEAYLGIDASSETYGVHKDLLEKQYVTAIKLDGPTPLIGDMASPWFDLEGGHLIIRNLEYGKYSLSMVYSECANIAKQGYMGDGNCYTDIKIENINISTSKPKVTAKGTASSPYYYKTVSDGSLSEATDVINDTDNAGTQSSCAVSGVGWIICPVARFMSGVIDVSWNIISGFLRTSPDIVGTDSSTYTVWKAVRNIANVAFVLVFLIIIFSQITSFGITNYGIKKLLPKLIVAAILVNLSFFICQIAVDISNIIGSSITGMFDSVTAGLDLGVTPTLFNGAKENAFFDTLTLGILGAGAVAFGALAVLIPALLSAIVAIVMILFILVARQAIIILLVIISPLAFVAFLLPNTEKLFKSWQKTGMAMLMLYPIVALVIGASTFASVILTKSFTDNSGIEKWIGQIAAAMVGVLPLFVVPGLLKKSLDGVGGIGKMINGIGDKAGKGASGKWSNSKLNKHLEAERANKRARIEGGVYEGGKFGKINPSVWRSNLHKKINSNTGKYGAKMAAMGVSQSDKYNEENVGLSSSKLTSMNLTKEQNRAIATGSKTYKYKDKDGVEKIGELKGIDLNDNALKQAAIKQMVATNDVDGMNTMWDQTLNDKAPDSQNSKFVRNTFANSLLSSSNRPAYMAAGAIASMRTHIGQTSARENIANQLLAGTYSAGKLAQEDKDAVAAINSTIKEYSKPENRHLIRGEGTQEEQDNNEARWHDMLSKLNSNATLTTTDGILKTQISKNEVEIRKLIDNTASYAQAAPIPSPAPAPNPTQAPTTMSPAPTIVMPDQSFNINRAPGTVENKDGYEIRDKRGSRE